MVKSNLAWELTPALSRHTMPRSKLTSCGSWNCLPQSRAVLRQAYGLQLEDWGRSALSVVVVGASGDLARKKIFPALYALYHEGMLPEVRGRNRSSSCYVSTGCHPSTIRCVSTAALAR